MRRELSPGFHLEFADDGQGTPLVLLHAFPLSRQMWRPQIEALASDCRLITPDLRGFGGTGPFSTTPSIDQMAEDVACLLEMMPLPGPVVLGGLSMGGYVALAFARKYPTRLRGLILADTRAEPDGDEARANRERTIQFATTNGPAALVADMLPKLLAEDASPQVAEEVRRIGSAQKVEGIVAALRALRDRPDATPVLPQMQAPALVIVGEKDRLTPPELSEKMAAALPNARLVRIPGSGHLANLENPEAFNDAVRSFLRELA